MWRFIVAVVLALAVAGCFPIFRSRPTADITPYIPAEFLSSGDEVLVLTETATRTTEGRATTVAAEFLKGAQLRDFAKGLKASSIDGLVVLVPAGVGAVPIGLPGGSQELHFLCIVRPDGLYVRLIPLSERWAIHSPGHFHISRRDAIVQALRLDGTNPFGAIDGPCGASGTVTWAPELRTRVTSYIEQLPPTKPVDDVRIPAFANRVNTIGDGSKAMLVGIARWRNEVEITPPAFLNTEEFEELKNLAPGLAERENSVFFPYHLSLYLSGIRSLEGLGIKTLCAIGSDGQILFWDAVYETWVHIKRPQRDWRNIALSNLNGEHQNSNNNDYCLPYRPNWSPAQLAQAIAFVREIPTKENETTKRNEDSEDCRVMSKGLVTMQRNPCESIKDTNYVK